MIGQEYHSIGNTLRVIYLINKFNKIIYHHKVRFTLFIIIAYITYLTFHQIMILEYNGNE